MTVNYNKNTHDWFPGHSREFCLVPSISDCSVLILLADIQLQCLLRGLQGSPVRLPPARFFSNTLTYVINLATVFFCAEILIADVIQILSRKVLVIILTLNWQLYGLFLKRPALKMAVNQLEDVVQRWVRKPQIKHHIWLQFVFYYNMYLLLTLCLYLHQAKHTYMCNLLCVIMPVKGITTR